MMEVRDITTKDLAILVKLSAEFLSEVEILDNATFDFDTLMNTLLNATTNPSWWGSLGYIDGQPAGMVIARRIGLFFSKKNVACDSVFFIRTEFRGSLLIRKLVRAYSDWAFGDENCVGAQLNAFAGKDNERGARLAAALGFPVVGFIAYKKRK